MNTNIGSDFRVRVPIAQISESSSTDANCTSEALYGEQITLLETHGKWGLVRQKHDGYEGFIKLDLLEISNLANAPLPNPTHWVSQRSTLLFQKPNLKSPIAHRIPFASELCLTSRVNHEFSKTSCGHFVWTDHCLRLEQKHLLNPMNLGKSMFLGAPYRWGGRSPEGADCSGLVQLLARSQGLSIPRDSGEQELFIEQHVLPDDYQSLDLVYWPGHTGILLDNETLLHETAFTLSCIIEPLSTVIDRAGPVSSVKRLFD